MLYCDIICLDYDGNILDASAFALLAALKNGKSSLEQETHSDEHCLKKCVSFESW